MNIFGTNLIRGICCALLVSPAIAQDADRDLTSNQSGTHNGFYYNFWKDSGDVTFGLREAGRYTSEWSDVNNWLGGVGWNPGVHNMIVSYSGQYNISNSQNSYLSLYGWTTNPNVEFYIVESYGSYNPASCASGQGQTYGTFQSDGAVYEISRCRRLSLLAINAPEFSVYFSVRKPKKSFGDVSGTITVANHIDAWAEKGMLLGKQNFMILATEGYQSTGSSDITVYGQTGPVDCGEFEGLPICCNISADPDGDGMGSQNLGRECIVTEETYGWTPNTGNSSSSSSSNSSASSSSSSSSSSGANTPSTGGGSNGWLFLMALSSLVKSRRRVCEQNSDTKSRNAACERQALGRNQDLGIIEDDYFKASDFRPANKATPFSPNKNKKSNNAKLPPLGCSP